MDARRDKGSVRWLHATPRRARCQSRVAWVVRHTTGGVRVSGPRSILTQQSRRFIDSVLLLGRAADQSARAVAAYRHPRREASDQLGGDVDGCPCDPLALMRQGYRRLPRSPTKDTSSLGLAGTGLPRGDVETLAAEALAALCGISTEVESATIGSERD